MDQAAVSALRIQAINAKTVESSSESLQTSTFIVERIAWLSLHCHILCQFDCIAITDNVHGSLMMTLRPLCYAWMENRLYISLSKSWACSTSSVDGLIDDGRCTSPDTARIYAGREGIRMRVLRLRI